MNIKALFMIALGTAIASAPLHAKNDKEKGNSSLPPGLQKKVARGGELPPGWQKKLEVGKPLDKEVYKHKEVVIPLDDKGLVTVKVEGKLIRLIEATREVVEVL